MNELDLMKEKFYISVKNRLLKPNSAVLTKEKYASLMIDVRKMKIKKESSRDYWLEKHYDIVKINGIEKLILPVSNQNENVKLYVMIEEIFDYLHEIHISIGHGGRDRMLYEINKRYKNITQSDVKQYLDLCIPCQQKKKSQKKGIVVKPMVFEDFNSRCQIDLIDFQSQSDAGYKFVLVYQDHLTKFCILRPLKCKRAEQIAYVLLDIFCLFGAPSVLQSDNGREFCNEIVNSLKEMWPELTIVHGKPRHSQSQGSVERANQDIENMLTTWMQSNNTNKWSEGLRFVQFMKNKALHSGIKRSPYEAMFGSVPKTGLSSSLLPKVILRKMESEEEAVSQQTINSGLETETRLDNMDDVTDVDRPTVGTEKDIVHLNIATDDVTDVDRPTVGTEKDIVHLNIATERKKAKENLEKQAKRMKDLSNTKFAVANIGSTVRIKIPDVDRGKGDPRSIIAVVLKLTDDGFYQLGCNDGKKNLNNTSNFLFFILIFYLFVTYLKHYIITGVLNNYTLDPSSQYVQKIC
ncbi:KRAB-A domain-containing protein 2-like isoform X1 [Metopolophium dirhodum]|uniref:KRAB-A domain-containing protein 2-like isoform X1 n=1 Tax=Metopolophium dirhodum TaxID=44670 RepID=UPI0029905D01|nr:KRAB-A domain-containing protein 2-like isoform X1 [Metopolophium dirhodum]